jgi:hypothetical protein
MPAPGDEGKEGDGLVVRLRYDSQHRWSADIFNIYDDLIDVFPCYSTAMSALVAVMDNLPGATFTPPDGEP